MLYLLTATPAVPGLTVLLTVADRSHHVAVRHMTGGIQVVLRHDGFHSGTHRHGIVARTLTRFARSASATNPDHVIQFSSPDSFSRQEQLNVRAPETMVRPDFALTEIRVPAPRENSLSFVPTHPPPGDDGQLVSLRSTLLLI